MTDDRTTEEILTGIAADLIPDVERAVAELGRDQVIRNIESGLDRLHARMAAREAASPPFVRSLDFRNNSPDEARVTIREALQKEPTATRKVYAGLAHKAWLLLRAEYSEEVRDWHALIYSVKAFIGADDPAAAERLTAIADLLRESISQAEVDRARPEGIAQ